MKITFTIGGIGKRKEWGDSFRLARLALGLTQAELAAHSGLSEGQIRYLESTGTLDIETIDKLRKLFGENFSWKVDRMEAK